MRQVITASRRTDLPARYTAWLSAALAAGQVEVAQPYGGKVRKVSLRPEDVHTLVLMSKDFAPLLRNEAGLRDRLSRYDQVSCHLTVTGLGGTWLEPKVPPAAEVLKQLPRLVAYLGDARRLTGRRP